MAFVNESDIHGYGRSIKVWTSPSVSWIRPYVEFPISVGQFSSIFVNRLQSNLRDKYDELYAEAFNPAYTQSVNDTAAANNMSVSELSVETLNEISQDIHNNIHIDIYNDVYSRMEEIKEQILEQMINERSPIFSTGIIKYKNFLVSVLGDRLAELYIQAFSEDIERARQATVRLEVAKTKEITLKEKYEAREPTRVAMSIVKAGSGIISRPTVSMSRLKGFGDTVEILQVSPYTIYPILAFIGVIYFMIRK